MYLDFRVSLNCVNQKYAREDMASPIPEIEDNQRKQRPLIQFRSRIRSQTKIQNAAAISVDSNHVVIAVTTTEKNDAIFAKHCPTHGPPWPHEKSPFREGVF